MATTTPAQTADGKPSTTASPELIQQKFELGIWHCLFNWQDLTAAVVNQWGGPDSADKRDWLAGAISDIFENTPATDALDIEVVLLQALEDEFGVRLEDETEVEVAKEIMRIRKETLEGNFATVDALQAKWVERKGKAVPTPDVRVEEREEEASDDDDDESDDDEDGDVDMSDAPQLVSSKPKPIPEVDEDGFTKVVGKHRH